MSFTPKDLAEIIGITSAPDGHHSNLPSQKQVQRAAETMGGGWEQDVCFWVRTPSFHALLLLKRSSLLSSLPSFKLEFASQYLPSLFRTYIETPFDLSGFYSSRLSSYLAHIGMGEYLPRLGREHPDTLVASFGVQLRRLASLVQIGLGKPGFKANASLASALLLLAQSSEAYFSHLQPYQNDIPSSLTFVRIPSDIVDLLRPHLARFEGMRLSSFQVEGADEIKLSVMIGRGKILEVIKTGGLRMSKNEDGFFSMYENVWWVCDVKSATNGLPVDVVARSPCSGTVEEMLVCSRVSLSISTTLLYLRRF
ncbi:hypothetical protein BDY24DRAFT_387206 [Mrakia frigida]|uniref:uncharacterized protein n=1 Tax=Mrakia frigida TaxID=29902 RepID=UPI003FCC0049